MVNLKFSFVAPIVVLKDRTKSAMRIIYLNFLKQPAEAYNKNRLVLKHIKQIYSAKHGFHLHIYAFIQKNI